MRTPTRLAIAGMLLAASVCQDVWPPLAAAGSPVFDALDRASILLARKGRAAEVHEVLAVEIRLGRAAADVARQRATCERTLHMAKAAAPPFPDAAKAVADAVAALAPELAERRDEERRAFATLLLELDSENEVAHGALGHRKVDGRWLTLEAAATLPRRAVIQDAVRLARRAAIEIETGPSDLALLRDLYGRDGTVARWKRVSVHSAAHSPEKLTRILRESLRALALAQWLETGAWNDVTMPAAPLPFILLESRERYEQAIAILERTGQIDAVRAQRARQLGSIAMKGGPVITSRKVEAAAEALVIYHVIAWHWSVSGVGRLQPCLTAGFVNWLGLTCIGAGLPRVAWIETEEGRGRTSDQPDALHREWMRIAEAGIAGTRSYLRFLAERNEDPAFAGAIVDQVGKIEGDHLLKATSVVEQLLELEEFFAVAQKTLAAGRDPGAFAAALGTPLADLESRWRAWLLRDGAPGLVQRLVGGVPAPAPDPVAARALSHLAQIRRAAARAAEPVSLDPDLAAGCALHAQYLLRHPEQLSAWPDAHEEYPDRDGFTTEGARAGLASVIVGPRVASPESAIDAWMGTFYHRLPLLDPGLVRIGWALVDGVAVLDAGSMAGPVPRATWVAWPPPDAVGVPLRFRPELPNPVPGEDQSGWGHPVTFQTSGYDTEPDVVLSLFVGKATVGDRVDCHLSTPARPTNLDLAPRGAACLIPKAALRPATSYTAVAEGLPDGARVTWTFTTAPR